MSSFIIQDYNIQKTTTVESIMNKDILCSDVVGLIGEPFEIETTSQFDTATLTYVIDKSKLGDTEFDNLLFLWYDEENDNFVELDTTLDGENSTVSVETTHFSKYMIVDGKEWYRAWQDIYTKINESKGQHIPNATVLISKSSNIYNVNNANRNELIVSNIVDSMSDSDIMSFLTYQNAGGMNTDFTSVKSALKWDPIYYSRTANASYGIGLAAVILNDEAMGYNSKIIFITDSSVSVDSRFLKLAINNKIPIYFFCIGDFNTAALIGYAQLTGGKVYSAKTAAEINQSCNEIGPKTFVGETDTDGDGFTDIEEMSGLIVSSNCKIVNTDYMKADTDDDGLDDNEEVDVELTKVEIPGKQGNPSIVKYYHHMWSDPTEKYCWGSDSDASKHTLRLYEDGEYKCSRCIFHKKSPSLQDKEILSDEDYLTVESLLKTINYYESKRNAPVNSWNRTHSEMKFIAKIDEIRRKEPYRNKYDLMDNCGYCYSEILNSQQYKELMSQSPSICEVVYNTVDDDDLKGRKFWEQKGLPQIILEEITTSVYDDLSTITTLFNLGVCNNSNEVQQEVALGITKELLTFAIGEITGSEKIRFITSVLFESVKEYSSNNTKVELGDVFIHVTITSSTSNMCYEKMIFWYKGDQLINMRYAY